MNYRNQLLKAILRAQRGSVEKHQQMKRSIQFLIKYNKNTDDENKDFLLGFD